jgi:hypothetical protein
MDLPGQEMLDEIMVGTQLVKTNPINNPGSIELGRRGAHDAEQGHQETFPLHKDME